LLKNYPANDLEIAEKIAKTKKRQFLQASDDCFEVDFLSGAVLFLKTKIFERIGFFNEEFFLFYEDNEICQKSINHNYKNLLLTSCRAFHSVGKSSKFSAKISNIYKIGWHLKGWSKFYFEQLRQGKIAAKIAAFLAVFLYLMKIIFLLFCLKPKRAALYFGGLVGIFYFLAGRKAFDQQGNPRG